MARVSLEAFLQGMAAATTGQIAGHMAGQQQADARDQQQFSQALQLAQLGGQQQDRQNALLTSQLPNLTPESQAQALTNIAATPSPLGTLANHPYVQKHPEYRPFFAQQAPAAPSPAGAPAGWMGAATGQAIPAAPAPGQTLAPGGGQGQPSFAIGGQTYALKGFDKAEAAKVTSLLEKTYDDMAKVALSDPAQIAARDELLRQKGRLKRIQSPEDLSLAQNLLNAAKSFHATVGGPQAAAYRKQEEQKDTDLHVKQVKENVEGLDDVGLASALPNLLKQERSLNARRGERGPLASGLKSAEQDIDEIEQMLAEGNDDWAAKLAGEVRRRWKAKVTPQQAAAKTKNAMAFLGQFSKRQMTPDLIRKAFENAEASFAIEGMSDAELQGFGSKALEGEWQKNFAILTNPKRWAGMPQQARKAILEEISGTAALTGRDLDLPADIIMNLTPQERAQLSIRRDQLKISGSNLEVAQARLKLDQDEFAYKKAQDIKRGGKDGKGSILTKNAGASAMEHRWLAAKKDFEGALKGAELNLAMFDPEHPNLKDPAEKRAAALYQEVQARHKALKTFLLKQGLDLDTGLETPVPTDAGGKLPTGKRSTADLLKRLGEIASEEEAKKAKP